MHKDIKKLIREIEANGYQVEAGFRSKQGRGHIKILGRDGKSAIASLPLSPGRGRWEMNLRSELKRKGILPR
jgi:hypothetical protein